MISSSLDAYRSHDLNIQMRTSSGDTISLDFSNRQELSMKETKDAGQSSSSFSFASMQSYSFEVDSNGISKQDKKEIQEFMKIAQPYIDNFMKELSGGEQSTSRGQVTKALNEVLTPLKGRGHNHQNQVKNDIVKTFDSAASQIEQFDKILNESQKLLENVLKMFDKIEQELYA